MVDDSLSAFQFYNGSQRERSSFQFHGRDMCLKMFSHANLSTGDLNHSRLQRGFGD